MFAPVYAGFQSRNGSRESGLESLRFVSDAFDGLRDRLDDDNGVVANEDCNLVDDDGDWLASVDGDRTPLPVVLACPLSVDLRVADVEEGVLPGVSLGMRLGVVESVLSRDKLEPCRLGGLLPGRLCGLLAGLLAGRLAGRLPVSPTFDFLTDGVDGFLTTEVLECGDDSLSLSESGVPAVRFTPILPIGTLLELRSRTFVIGPAVDTDRCCCALCFGLNADMLCDTPSANMNCSRSSMFVRPLALHGSFLTKNSSRATQPPPTRTITVDLNMRTRRSF